ncbi:MAG: hypothetical protein HEEMFOPI_01667 [Holosporales bacterium]
MSTNDLYNAFRELDYHNIVYDISGKKSYNTIDEVEKIINYKLPATYKIFLIEKGNFFMLGFLTYGIISNEIEKVVDSGLLYAILEDRKAFNIPENILYLEEIGDGSYYALDLSQMNEEQECPVVIWPVGGYEETPELEIVAPDFGTWFYDQVMQQIEIQKKKN